MVKTPSKREVEAIRHENSHRNRDWVPMILARIAAVDSWFRPADVHLTAEVWGDILAEAPSIYYEDAKRAVVNYYYRREGQATLDPAKLIAEVEKMPWTSSEPRIRDTIRCMAVWTFSGCIEAIIGYPRRSIPDDLLQGLDPWNPTDAADPMMSKTGVMVEASEVAAEALAFRKWVGENIDRITQIVLQDPSGAYERVLHKDERVV